ncbi:hypothetical protein Q3G72_008755 [Acer saccharum]|nr:hypothetical protein Q3G72_008755 [Acer saccharum]
MRAYAPSRRNGYWSRRGDLKEGIGTKVMESGGGDRWRQVRWNGGGQGGGRISSHEPETVNKEGSATNLASSIKGKEITISANHGDRPVLAGVIEDSNCPVISNSSIEGLFPFNGLWEKERKDIEVSGSEFADDDVINSLGACLAQGPNPITSLGGGLQSLSVEAKSQGSPADTNETLSNLGELNLSGSWKRRARNHQRDLVQKNATPVLGKSRSVETIVKIIMLARSRGMFPPGRIPLTQLIQKDRRVGFIRPAGHNECFSMERSRLGE